MSLGSDLPADEFSNPSSKASINLSFVTKLETISILIQKKSLIIALKNCRNFTQETLELNTR